METLTIFRDFAKQQLWGVEKEVVLPQTNKVLELQKRIYAEENSGIGAQITKGALVLGGTVCSFLGAFVLLGKTVKELEVDTDVMEGRLGRHLLAAPEVKVNIAPVSVFPTNIMVTVISMFDLFSDPDGQSLTLEVQSIPSWMMLESSTYLMSTCNTPNRAEKVHVVENLAYIADAANGLTIIDVSNPSSPTLRGRYDTPGYAYGVYVNGNVAYVADYANGLQIIDVSNPSFPVLKGTYNTSGYAYSVYVIGNLAYVADDTSGLTIIDVSNSSSPILKGTYDTPGQAFRVQVVENLAYVSDYSSLKIINISNPSSPTLKATSFYGALSVYVVGSLAYVGDYSLLRIIDVSDPSFPILKGTCDTPGTINSIYVSENFAYIADDTYGLQIIDVSNSSSPILKAAYDTPGTARGVYFIRNLAYVADFNGGLQIIDHRFKLSGTPNQTQVGNYEIELIAKDPDQTEVSQILRVRVEGPPIASSAIPNQLINVDTPFTYFIDQNVFSDPNNDVIFYSSKLVNQNPLPSWLSFSSIGIFSGSPTFSDVGAYTIKVSAFDGIASELAVTTFSLSVDHFPRVATTISDHAADIGKLYNYTVPTGTFTDADVGDVLTYNATLSNGDSLPSWLSFNALSLSGTPSGINAGPFSIQLSATDQAGAKAQTSFTVTVEHFPELVNPLPNQLASIGQTFNFVLPSNTYTDLDGDTLTYKATRSDGSNLPNWLVFNDLRQEFQGTPLASDKGGLGLRVIAKDPKGGQVTAAFNLNIVDVLGERQARIGGNFIYIIPNNMMNNPQGPITYTVTLGDGSPLPTWLEVDPVNGIISGIPPSTSDSEYTLLITANDFVQPEVFGSLNLLISANAAPEVANFISNQAAQVNQNYRFVVPDNTFVDPNGDSLTLSAFRANGRGLPSWLKFNVDLSTLEGKPGPGDTGSFTDKVLSLQICATDGEKQACSIFNLSVQGFSNQERALSIAGPLASAAAIGLAWYKKRGLIVNLFNKDKYDKGIKVVLLGQPFTYKLETEVNKIKFVQAFKGQSTIAGIPVPKSLDEKGWFEWLKADKAIRGGHLLPRWLEYNERKNQLTSKSNPCQENAGFYVVRVYGPGDVILEEIKLDVGGQGSKSVEMLEMQRKK